MKQNKYELWAISFCKTISKEVYTTCQFVFLSHPLLHPHNSVHFKFCFLQWQHFMQLVPQLHLMSSLQAWDASAIVVQIDSIPSSLSFHPHSSMLISLDHFLFALHHYIFCSHCFFLFVLLQNMNKNYTEKIFNHAQQNAVIISNFYCKFDINQL